MNPLHVHLTIDFNNWFVDLPDSETLVETIIQEAFSHGALKFSAQDKDNGHTTLPSAEVSVLLTGDATLQALNKTYRGKDKPTNVLSFPTAEAASLGREDPLKPILLGDIVVAFETVQKEAEDYNESLKNHLSHLLVHGTLHLLGYDHETPLEAKEMEERESEILQRLGLPSPYEDPHETCDRSEGE